MKAFGVKSLLVTVCVLLLGGCPWLENRQNPRFTSANVSTNSRQTEGDYLAAGMDMDDAVNEPETVERELVEPDVIRRDGSRLYVLNQYRGLTIADLVSETVLSQTPTYGYPRDLYLEGERAYVLVSYARDLKVEENLISVVYGTKLYVLNVSDPRNVVPEGTFLFKGDLIDSRLVGNVLYAVCSDYTLYETTQDGVVSTESEQVSYGATWAVSINIADPRHIYQEDVESFSGSGNLIQATNYALFVAGYDYGGNTCRITYVDISDPNGQIVVRGNALAPGYMADRFKMDAWNGALRVVTNTWWPDRQTYVTTFDITNPDTMAQLGQTTLASASDESLYATRFDGPRAYVVTYFTVDPLFVIDLSDPTAPAVAGELKIPGWSTHIEPRGDRLIALGVDDQAGRRVMVSLFDVSNPAAPQRLDYASFGEGWSWSSAYDDVKAFTVLEDMILVPFSGWNEENGVGYDRLQFVTYSRTDLEAQGYVDVQGSVVRSFAYGDQYYAVTQEELAVINAGSVSAPLVENTLILAENVADILPLSNGWTVEVILRQDTGDTLLRAVNLATGENAGETIVPAASVSEAFVWNNAVVLTVPVYQYDPEYRAYYEVWLVDFTDIAAPVITGEWMADMEPWRGGWWWDRGIVPMNDMVEPVAAVSNSKDMWYYPYYYTSDPSAFLAGDYIILRGTRSNGSWWFFDGETRDTLAVIDLADVDSLRYVDLGQENIHSIASVDNLLYLTSYDAADSDENAYCAYYLQTLNPFDLSRGPRINVPGVFMHKVPGTDFLVLEDQQYTSNGGTHPILRSVTLSGNNAELVDSVEFPEGSWEFSANGTDIFFSGMSYTGGDYDVPTAAEGSGGSAAVNADSSESQYKVGLYMLSHEGAFESGATCPVSTSWVRLMGARNLQVYLTVSDTALARYDFRQSPPVLAEMTPVMSSPGKIRFGDGVYAPLGYSGVAVLE